MAFGARVGFTSREDSERTSLLRRWFCSAEDDGDWDAGSCHCWAPVWGLTFLHAMQLHVTLRLVIFARVAAAAGDGEQVFFVVQFQLWHS